MLSTTLLPGQGLGNQLWVIFALQKFAADKGLRFAVRNRERLKSSGFPNLDLGPDPILPKSDGPHLVLKEPQIFHPDTGENITTFDPTIGSKLTEWSEIEGYFQSVNYLPSKSDIQTQLATEGETFDGCTISFRGGEYKGISGVYLPPNYYQRAIEIVRERYGGETKFRVVTDDAKEARRLFPGFPVHSSGGVKRLPFLPYLHPSKQRVARDFALVQKSRYHILSNSSFAWWACYSSTSSEFAIAPKYWAAFNRSNGYWSQGDSLTPGWMWLGRDGSLLDYQVCHQELEQFRKIWKFGEP